MYAIQLTGRIRVGAQSIGILEPVQIVLDARYNSKDDAARVIGLMKKAAPTSSITREVVEV